MVDRFILPLAELLRQKVLPTPYDNADSMLLENLIKTLLGPTAISTSGYPVVTQLSYNCLLEKIPFLFSEGQSTLVTMSILEEMIAKKEFKDWWLKTLNQIGENTTDLGTPEGNQRNQAPELRWNQDITDLNQSIKVIRNTIFTAGITAPSDLWLIKYVLSSFNRLNILSQLNEKGSLEAQQIINDFSLDATQFMQDLHFLKSRKILVSTDNQVFSIPKSTTTVHLLENIKPIPSQHNFEWVSELTKTFKQKKLSPNLKPILTIENTSPNCHLPNQWSPSLFHIELGYRLLPLVLALRSMNLTPQLKLGISLTDKLNFSFPEMESIFNLAGLVDTNNYVTELGDRVFQRGSGPFGIIHAYHAYMTEHLALLKGNKEKIWVARGENVSASQDANSRTFKMINDSLDLFAKENNFTYSLFIEHAVGHGEATRQRYERDGEGLLQYFGADLEDAAIAKAKQDQSAGLLPQNMKFIHNADIGNPKLLIDGLTAAGFSPQGAVMVVGNGFHEIRNQTNEKMVQVFKEYCEAGILIIFTEESGLTDDDLIETGWNTYHAGFRYVHAISGQGLRPSIDTEQSTQNQFSWSKCASLAGYQVLEKYSSSTRTIFPYPKPNGYNPCISVNYFCSPEPIDADGI